MSQLFEKILKSVPEETKAFIDKSMGISDHVHEILEHKGISQREFAELLGKSESEVSKWLSGSHNLTIKSIVKMETVLNEKLLVIPHKGSAKYSSKMTIHIDKKVRDHELPKFKGQSAKINDLKNLNEDIFVRGLKSA